MRLLQVIVFAAMMSSNIGCSTGGTSRESQQNAETKASASKTEKMIVNDIKVGDRADDLKVLLSAAKVPFDVSCEEGGAQIHIWALDEKRILHTKYLHAIVHVKDGLVTQVDKESIGVGP